jgi:arginase
MFHNVKICDISNKLGYYNLRELHTVELSNQRVPITIGGDHSLAMSTVSSTLDYFKDRKVRVVWVDAHADIHTYQGSETKNLHGMPVSTLLGVDNLMSIDTILKPDQVSYIGLRDVDYQENKRIQELNIESYSAENVKFYGIEKIMEFITEDKEDEIYHVSIDVDSIDPSEFPCTGTSVPDGLSENDIHKIVDHLKESIVSLDIVEYNPHIFEIASDKERCNEVIERILKNFANIK